MTESSNLVSELHTFVHDGVRRQDRTYRTPIIEALTMIEGRTFIDLGSERGHESYSLGVHGAKYVLGIEGRDHFLEIARTGAAHFQVADRVQFEKRDVRILDDPPPEPGKFDVILCFGLLYHMENPFNVLKRLRNICAGELILETHIAPLTFEGTERGEVAQLSDLTVVELDDVPFEGRVLKYLADEKTNSLDRRMVLWMTIASIQKALALAGFEVLLTVFEHPPAHLEPWSTMLGHNQKQLKALFHARVREPERIIPVPESRISGLHQASFSYVSLRGFRRWRRVFFHRLSRLWSRQKSEDIMAYAVLH